MRHVNLQHHAITMLGMAVIAVLAASASAGSVNVFGDKDDSIRLPGETGSFRQGSGGEFKIEFLSGSKQLVTGMPADNIGGGPAGRRFFQTFCLEKDEFIWNSPNPYSYLEPVDAIARGGGNNTNLGDPISPQTAWLYTEFRLGTLSGYDYTGTTRAADADDLQKVIWAMENELNVTVGAESGELAVKALVSSTQAKGWVTAAFAGVAGGFVNTNVVALNLMHGSTEKQDQLAIVVPTPTTVAGGAVLLIGLVSVQQLRRRRDELLD